MALFTSQRAYAMKQSDLAGKVYIVTYLNTNALRTSYQYMFFTANGKAAVVPVADVDGEGQPIVTEDATGEQKKALAQVKRLLNDRHYLHKQAKTTPLQIKKNRVYIKANGLKANPAGKLTKNSRVNNFTVEYSNGQQKYTSVQFKLAPQQLQYK